VSDLFTCLSAREMYTLKVRLPLPATLLRAGLLGNLRRGLSTLGAIRN
jgi:hypothetical protein